MVGDGSKSYAACRFSYSRLLLLAPAQWLCIFCKRKDRLWRFGVFQLELCCFLLLNNERLSAVCLKGNLVVSYGDHNGLCLFERRKLQRAEYAPGKATLFQGKPTSILVGQYRCSLAIAHLATAVFEQHLATWLCTCEIS
jgi:hypothetical protein